MSALLGFKMTLCKEFVSDVFKGHREQRPEPLKLKTRPQGHVVQVRGLRPDVVRWRPGTP